MWRKLRANAATCKYIPSLEEREGVRLPNGTVSATTEWLL